MLQSFNTDSKYEENDLSIPALHVGLVSKLCIIFKLSSKDWANLEVLVTSDDQKADKQNIMQSLLGL